MRQDLGTGRRHLPSHWRALCLDSRARFFKSSERRNQGDWSRERGYAREGRYGRESGYGRSGFEDVGGGYAGA